MSNLAWEPARRAWLLLAVLAFAPLLAPAKPVKTRKKA